MRMLLGRAMLLCLHEQIICALCTQAFSGAVVLAYAYHLCCASMINMILHAMCVLTFPTNLFQYRLQVFLAFIVARV